MYIQSREGTSQKLFPVPKGAKLNIVMSLDFFNFHNLGQLPSWYMSQVRRAKLSQFTVAKNLLYYVYQLNSPITLMQIMSDYTDVKEVTPV